MFRIDFRGERLLLCNRDVDFHLCSYPSHSHIVIFVSFQCLGSTRSSTFFAAPQHQMRASPPPQSHFQKKKMSTALISLLADTPSVVRSLFRLSKSVIVTVRVWSVPASRVVYTKIGGCYCSKMGSLKFKNLSADYPRARKEESHHQARQKESKSHHERAQIPYPDITGMHLTPDIKISGHIHGRPKCQISLRLPCFFILVATHQIFHAAGRWYGHLWSTRRIHGYPDTLLTLAHASNPSPCQ